MCQVSVYVKRGENEELLKEDITKLELTGTSLKISTLFEGMTEFSDLQLRCIDFSAGKILLEEQQ